MDFLQFFGYIRQFNADVAIIGAAVWGINLLLRKTLLKNFKKSKLAAFLPFLLGALLYTAYTAAVSGPAGMDWNSALSAGITCGSLATVIQVVYEQFTTGGKSLDIRAACVKALLSDYGEISDETAVELEQAVAEENSDRALELLKDIVGETMAETLYSMLCRTLDSLNN